MEDLSHPNNKNADDPLVSFILPALNEEEKIKETLKGIPTRKLRKRGYNTEIIVIDGGSEDRTQEIALNQGARVIIEKKQGYGHAYMVGFKYARGDLIVTGDADGTYPLELASEMIQKMEEKNLDLLITNRLISENTHVFPPVHFVGNKLLSFLARILFNLRVKDSQSGMWIFKRKILDNSTFYGEGMEFSTEYKIEATKESKKFGEVPINYQLRTAGASKVNWAETGLRIALFMLKKRFLTLLS